MKKRLCALLCVLLMVVQVAAQPAQAVSQVYFTAVNEELMDLSDSTMPFWSGGYLYVASSVFTANLNELGLAYSRNWVSQTMALWMPAQNNRALVFDLIHDTVMDENGSAAGPAAILKGSVIFLPVGAIANYFGFAYSSTRVSNGYLVRLRSDKAVLTDRQFIDAAQSQLLSQYSAYLAAKQGGRTEPQEDPAEPPQEEPVVTEGGQTIYLCFRAAESGKTAALLDTLDVTGVKASVYFTAEEIAASEDLARRAVGTGMSVGLVADAGLELPVEEQLERANAALWQAAERRTRFCWIENGDEDSIARARAAGYCCLTPDLDRSGYGLNSSANASYLLQRIGKSGRSVKVWLGSRVSAAGLRALVAAAGEADDHLLAMTETA